MRQYQGTGAVHGSETDPCWSTGLLGDGAAGWKTPQNFLFFLRKIWMVGYLSLKLTLISNMQTTTAHQHSIGWLGRGGCSEGNSGTISSWCSPMDRACLAGEKTIMFLVSLEDKDVICTLLLDRQNWELGFKRLGFGVSVTLCSCLRDIVPPPQLRHVVGLGLTRMKYTQHGLCKEV